MFTLSRSGMRMRRGMASGLVPMSSKPTSTLCSACCDSEHLLTSISKQIRRLKVLTVIVLLTIIVLLLMHTAFN